MLRRLGIEELEHSEQFPAILPEVISHIMHLLLEALLDPGESLTEQSLVLERVENPECAKLVQLTMFWE